MPEISVIVPVYNVEKYLLACLDSILAQTFTDFELILIDDGSPDSSGKICDEYADKDSRIRVFHQENQGQAAARNFGVTQAKADWIHFVDSDDIIHPQMLEILYNGTKEKKQVQISVCSVLESHTVSQEFFSTVYPEYEYTLTDEDALTNLYKNVKYVYWIACAKLIKKDLVEQYPFPCGKIYEDNAVVFKWLADSGTVAQTDAKLYFYRINPTGTTKSRFTVKQADFLFALEEQIAFYKAKGYSNLIPIICHRYLFEYSVIHKRILCELNDKSFAKKLRKHAVFLWVKNFSAFANCNSEFLFSLETFFPKLHNVLICLLKILK